MPGAKKANWWKLTKFVQFAYRRMLIPGTSFPPFMVARGRQSSLSTEPERLELGDALPSAPPLSEHMKELTKHMELAVELLSKARDRTLVASREKFNSNQTEVNFELQSNFICFIRRFLVAQVRRLLRAFLFMVRGPAACAARFLCARLFTW